MINVENKRGSLLFATLKNETFWRDFQTLWLLWSWRELEVEYYTLQNSNAVSLHNSPSRASKFRNCPKGREQQRFTRRRWWQVLAWKVATLSSTQSSLIMIFAKDFLGQVRRLLTARKIAETTPLRAIEVKKIYRHFFVVLATHFHSKLYQTCSIILLLMFSLCLATKELPPAMWTCFEVATPISAWVRQKNTECPNKICSPITTLTSFSGQ